MPRLVIALLLCLGPALSAAAEVRFQKVAENVYVHVGDVGARTVQNEALNANIGLVVAPGGAIVIDPGATFLSARDIHQAVARITPLPVRWVINTGGQDHRWLGNGYFRDQGAELIAHASAVPDMRARAGDQIQALRALLGARFDGTHPVFPDRLIAQADATLDLGGARVELLHRGGGHTPGDMMVWLPAQGALFAGDIVYVDRLLAVLPVSNTRQWLAAFDEVERLAPKVLIPGHGQPATLSVARAQTRDYLSALRAHMRRSVDDLQDIGVAIRSFDLEPFKALNNAVELHPGNASRVYLEMERE